MSQFNRTRHPIALWGVESGKPQFRLTYTEPIYLRARSFTSDDDFIVGGGNDTAIRTWDVRLEEAPAARPQGDKRSSSRRRVARWAFSI